MGVIIFEGINKPNLVDVICIVNTFLQPILLGSQIELL